MSKIFEFALDILMYSFSLNKPKNDANFSQKNLAMSLVCNMWADMKMQLGHLAFILANLEFSQALSWKNPRGSNNNSG